MLHIYGDRRDCPERINEGRQRRDVDLAGRREGNFDYLQNDQAPQQVVHEGMLLGTGALWLAVVVTAVSNAVGASVMKIIFLSVCMVSDPLCGASIGCEVGHGRQHVFCAR